MGTSFQCASPTRWQRKSKPFCATMRCGKRWQRTAAKIGRAAGRERGEISVIGVQACAFAVYGYVVPMRQPVALAEKIKTLLRDDALRKKMAKNSREDRKSTRRTPVTVPS